jgi:hypothetical protein
MTTNHTMRTTFVGALGCVFLSPATALATENHFFSSGQVATSVSTDVTSDTIRCDGYLFTYTRDKLFTGGTGQIIGRSVRVPWPSGVEAQAVTTPTPGVTDYKARLTIRRVDGAVFDLVSFTAKLLANTAGTGASIEIMPLINGEDAFNDPIYFDASGYYSQTFSYNETPNVWGSTASLHGFDTYKINLFVDFGFTALVLRDASSPACPADLVPDGGVDINDLLLFLAEFESGATGADLDNGTGAGTPDGGVDINDLLYFLVHFEAGC